MKIFNSVILICFFCRCTNSGNKDLIKSNYYDIIDKSYNDMSLWFRVKQDSVFLFYCNVIDDGNYLNCPYDDSTDYAGSFSYTEIKNSIVQLKVKNYRNDDLYSVLLTFHSNGNNITWKINSEYFSYLPKNAEFSVRDSTSRNSFSNKNH